MKINRRKIQLILADTLVLLVLYLAYAALIGFRPRSIRVNGGFTLWKVLTLWLCIMGARSFLKVYHNIWRYANVTTYIKLVMADVAGGLLFILLGRMFDVVNLGLSSSLLVILSFAIASLYMRFFYQALYAYQHSASDKQDAETRHKINIAIVGAGNVGASLADELIRNPKSHYKPCCFIDNDKNKVGNDLNGIPVIQGDEGIVDVIKAMPVQEVVIAIPDADPETKQRLYSIYKQTDCKVKIYDYIRSDDGKNKGKRTLRDIRIEDLLFRESLDVSSSAARAFYTGKTVLITGGGGSIGSELCRQIAAMQPKKLAILDIYENNAYEIQQELVRKYGSSLDLEVIIASVRDVKRLDEVFRNLRPNIVFHAAAHKHVPLMENNPCEAIKNNVLGTYNTANMAERYGVEKFLLISTDKAVNPTNVMGASKRLCEMVIQCRKDSTCEFTAVRFGNVLGSNGSVIPLFRKQIENGGPVTLTDKRIVRYFMTIPEAVGLVMEACAMAHNGELFVLDMGKPVKILELAENMIRLSGLTPYKDIDITEIGLRPGEKLYEELLMSNEELGKTENRLIFIERDKPLSREELEHKLTLLREALITENKEAIVEAVRQTVPTYHNPEELNRQAIENRKASEALAARV